ncbi:PREDICTED: aldehyde oxidase 2-like [Haliaeetus leucocephalus]|uniref:aldehyde oxidase 2-like n=1 Tax=Haliaeetus leucocephalus TaxID=52644 RepID=UPI00053CDDDD|nr:PREDICTED: aldehyde oxidase 2-like [Haliaeetus leucocephalus]
MAQEQQRTTLIFHGKRTTWISPPSLKELLNLKAKYPKAPLVVGNTSVGLKKNHHGAYHPIILHPVRIPEMHVVSSTNDGLVIGAACCLAQLRDILMEAVPKLAEEKTKIYRALLQHLRTLAGEQMRSMASLGGHTVSRGSTWDLNPISSVGKSVLSLASEDGKRQILLNDQFLAGCEHADLKAKEVIVSVLIPYSMKNDFISAFRQAESQKNALSIANSGMRILFCPGTDTIVDLSILYGGIGSTILSARKSCEKLIGRQWNDQMLNEACRLVLEEIFLPPSALGGKVEYRRTLLVSFLFRFYLEVLHGLNQMDVDPGVTEKDLTTIHTPGQSPQDPVSRPIMHQSGIKHTTGEAVYIDDIRPVDGELSLALVTNIKAHAKITSIDASEALQVPGAVDVVTARDVPGENGKDEQAYAEDKVVCVGQIICAVVAESLTQAKCGAEKVKIVYEDLEPILTIEENGTKVKCWVEMGRKSVIQEGHTDGKRIRREEESCIFPQGDSGEGELHMGGQEHFYLETNSVLVIPGVEDKEMDVYVSTQHATDVQEFVASALNLQYNKIMCHMKRVGGAFGGKITKPLLFAVIAAVAANKCWKYMREKTANASVTILQVGFMNDGRIRAADFQCYINGGCTKDESESVIEYPVLKVDNAYNILNLRVRGHACKTNLPSNTAFRGFEFPQAGLFVETCIVAVATQTGLPHEKVREINMYKGVNLTSFKEKFDAENLWKCWEECLDKSDYYSQKAMVKEFNTKNYWKKKGIAIIPMKFSVGFNATYFHQIASRELKIPLSYIHLCETSTTVPSGKYTAGSIGAEINARAVQDACQILWKHLDPIQRDNPNGKWEDWNIGTDIVMDACFTINPTIDIGQIEGAFIQGVGLYTLEEIFISPEGEQLTLGPDTYKIPAICDIPEQFCVYLLPNSRNSIAIYSSKGVGEARFFLGSSVFFAIRDAVAAARKERGLPLDFTLNSPLAVERIHMACDDVFTEMRAAETPRKAGLRPAPGLLVRLRSVRRPPRSANQARRQPSRRRTAAGHRHPTRDPPDPAGWGGTAPAARGRRPPPQGLIHAHRRRGAGGRVPGGYLRVTVNHEGGGRAHSRGGGAGGHPRWPGRGSTSGRGPVGARGPAAPGRPLEARRPREARPPSLALFLSILSGGAGWSVPGGAERGPPLFLSRWFRSESFRRRSSLLLAPASAPGRSGVFSLP